VRAGEQLIATVYKAIRGNPNLWPNTAILVVYDEHGGIYSGRAEAPAESMIVNLSKQDLSLSTGCLSGHMSEKLA
jgi:phospholipase C